MSDLLNYSIMHPRSPTSSNGSSFSSPRISFNAPPPSSSSQQAAVLPPINTLIPSQPDIKQQQQQLSPSSQIKLPPLNTSSCYTLTRPSLPSTTSICSHLTESNLSQFQSNRDSHGLGLLSSAIFLDQQQQQTQQQKQFQSSSRSSSVPSLASSASSISSYFSSPTTPEIAHSSFQQQQQPTPVATPKSTTTISSTSGSTSSSCSSSTNKRRQRLGPSCDSCRARKVKCNAEITILSPSTTTLASTYNLTSHQLDLLTKNNKLSMNGGDFQLLYVNEKYIHFKPCHSCEGKGIDCCFSQGFTKEDILSNKKKSKKLASSAGKVTKDTSRASSASKKGVKNVEGVCMDKLLNCGALTEAQVGITA
ncbi:SUT1 [Candida metapsilosis]|uniref:SUT1 n=1 Tax=Candida metapsilosis TaxID=273372 RepID=A0A8H7ZGM0_9ASCO|nr:SUT1 [Candida metapsilosis]